MVHLFICREYPPAAYPPGGIGTYLRYITGLLASAGETVHVIAHRWDGAPLVREESLDGRLIVHRVALDDPAGEPSSAAAVPRALLRSSFPSQAFAWQAAWLAERLVETEGIDVIEAQEWEAPLYYFQLRRTLGLGPASRPPCIVHLHSPSELIFKANGWDTAIADYPPAVAQETFSITTADALLCPSRFLADQAIARYGVPPSRMHVIPYPLGDVPHLDRTAGTWSSGTICHVGRLEPRKGVFEWIETLAMAAASQSRFTMEFIGGDIPLQPTGGAMVGAALRASVPKPLRRHLRFRGSHSRPDVFAMLSNAWAAVVPSRWDNLPYSCIEAMGTGLPIIASPNGGMRELVEDGVSGWIASDATPSGLMGALSRALATSGAERKQMGDAAERAVRRICDNDAIVRQHLEVKTGLRDTARPGQWAVGRVPRTAATGARSGVAVMTTAPDATFPAEALAEDPLPLAIAFVEDGGELEPDALARCVDVLATHEDVGVVGGWMWETAARQSVLIPPMPDAPHLDASGHLMPFIVVRAQACHDAIHDLRGRAQRISGGDVVAAMLSAGWRAVTYPSVLARMPAASARVTSVPRPARYSLTALAVQRAHTPLIEWLRTCPPEERRALLRNGLMNPMRALRGLAARAMWRRRGRSAHV